MPKVWNKKTDKNIPANAVYCGRPSRWGNPFTIGKDGTRAEVIIKYKAWIMNQPVLIFVAQHDLRGRDLICFCAPYACHCHTLLLIANCDSPLGDICNNICGYCDDCYENEMANIANERG